MANEQNQQAGDAQQNQANEGGTQKSGGGATGYDVNREQKQVNKEGDHMHNERNEEDLNVEEGKPSPKEQESIPAEKPKPPQQK